MSDSTSELIEALSIEDLVGLGEPIYTAEEVAKAAGVSREGARRIWLALGFVDPPEDTKFFTEQDREILQRLSRFIDAGLADIDLVLGVTRAMSRALRHVAEAEADAIREAVLQSPERVTKLLEEGGVSQLFDDLESFLVHAWRRHLADAVTRSEIELVPGEEAKLVVGFADLVGFTRLSRYVDAEELEAIVDRFESTAHDLVTEFGGRVVKTIGDEVMFVADDVERAVEIGLRLIDVLTSGDEANISLRVGIAYGPVVAHRGDYFGPTTNLASRAAKVARRNTLLVSEEVRDVLEERDDLEVKPIPRTRLKGIGAPRLWAVRRTSQS
jgi:adenylate cyclase